MYGIFLEFDHCVSLNFGYHDSDLSIPQIAMTQESNTKLIFDSPISCFIVLVGGKYLNMIGDVMEKVNSFTNDVGRIRLLAVFLLSINNKKDLTIDVKYGLERYKSAPVMVRKIALITNIYINACKECGEVGGEDGGKDGTHTNQCQPLPTHTNRIHINQYQPTSTTSNHFQSLPTHTNPARQLLMISQ